MPSPNPTLSKSPVQPLWHQKCLQVLHSIQPLGLYQLNLNHNATVILRHELECWRFYAAQRPAARHPNTKHPPALSSWNLYSLCGFNSPQQQRKSLLKPPQSNTSKYSGRLKKGSSMVVRNVKINIKMPERWDLKAIHLCSSSGENRGNWLASSNSSDSHLRARLSFWEWVWVQGWF